MQERGVTMQIHLLSALLFGVSSNTDNLVVGMSYGIKKMPIRWSENLIVALITFYGNGFVHDSGQKACSYFTAKNWQAFWEA